MKSIVVLVTAFLVVSSCSEAQETTERTSEKTTTNQTEVINRVVSASEFAELMKGENVQLIDVRTPEEYNAGKIGDAVNMNFYDANFKEQVATLDRTKPTLVYCAAGGRSGKSAQLLKSMGFKEVYDLSGGYGQWPNK